MLGVTPGLFGNHWVSGSLEARMHVLLQVLVVLICSVSRVFSCSLHYLGSLSSPPFFIVLFIVCPGGSPLFFQFSVMGAGAGFSDGQGLWLGGKALWCSSYLGLN